jgi:hypothetical protein
MALDHTLTAVKVLQKTAVDGTKDKDEHSRKP